MCKHTKFTKVKVTPNQCKVFLFDDDTVIKNWNDFLDNSILDNSILVNSINVKKIPKKDRLKRFPKQEK